MPINNRWVENSFSGMLHVISVEQRIEQFKTYDCTSGSHCVVRVGHSRAVLSSRSYKKGEFFFHVLYLRR